MTDHGGARRAGERGLIDRYMHSVGGVPLLSRAEELRLTRRLERARLERRLAIWAAPWETPALLPLLEAGDADATSVDAARARQRELACGVDEDAQDELYELEQGSPVAPERVDALADRVVAWAHEARGEPSLAALIEAEAGLPLPELEGVADAVAGADDRIARTRNEIVAANLRLVAHLALRYRGMGLPLTDLMQEGNLGLMHGVEKFDHRRGHRLSTYVSWWIRQSMTRALSDQSRTVRVPVQVLERITRLRKARQRFAQRRGRAPREEELATDLEMPVPEMRALQRASRVAVSLDAPVGDDGDTLLGDLLADPAGRDPAEVAEVRDLQDRTQRAMASLTPRERLVLRRRFGIGMEGRRTLEEVGAEIGLTRERVRQLQQEALAKLRARGVLDDLVEATEE